MCRQQAASARLPASCPRVLELDVELASPPDFIPELPCWRERGPRVLREGSLSVHHFDFHSQAPSKIERRWALSGGGELAVALEMPGTGGYRDLRRAARHVALQDTVVALCSLRDLVRIADASPRSERRAFLPALWATLEMTEDADDLDARAA